MDALPNLNTPYIDDNDQGQPINNNNTSVTNTEIKTTTELNNIITQGSIEFSDFKDSVEIDGRLRVQLQIPPPEAQRKLLLIVMVDKSGSMRHCWNQVQTSLQTLFNITLNQPTEIVLELIFFNNTAYRLTWTPENYRQLISAESANGKTCFAALFSLTADILRNYYRKGTAFKSDLYYDPKTDVAMVLLTDGSHTTVRDHRAAFADLRQLIKTIGCAQITVHTMGFTENSRFSDLDGIRRLLGSREGIYQYAEPTDGPFALQDKLNFIFKYIFTTGDTFSSTLGFDVNDEVLFMENGTSNLPMKLIFDADGICDLSLSVIRKSSANLINPVNFTVKLENSKYSIRLPPIFLAQTEDALVLRKLSRYNVALNQLFTRVNSHGHDNVPSDQDKKAYISELIDLQKKLNEIDNDLIFSFAKDKRQVITDQKVTCLNQVSQLLELINTWVKQEWTAKTSARMADITYQFMFKNSRQRRATAKITKNANTMMNDATKFKSLDIDVDELLEQADKNLMDASQQLFSCTLSLCNWTELIEDRDCLGFGLSIQRPETVIDEPTQIRIIDYSTTFLGKSSLEDAIALSVHSVGHEKTTGGFGVGRNVVAAAVKGRGREPINSWMPLYLHESHWETIKYQLRSIIGYFVTLDPMAFSYDQINVCFLLLGTMVSKDIGERQLYLVIQFIRTCREITLHFKFLDYIKKQLTAVLTRPLYSIAEQPKNIFVVIGYLMILNDNEMEELFGKDFNWVRVWEVLAESAIRRASYTFFKESDQSEIDSFIYTILYGEAATVTPTTTNEDNSTQIDTIFESVNNYKPFDVVLNNQTEDDVKKYFNIKKLQDLPKCTDYESLENKTLENVVKFSNLVENKGYPTLSSIHSCFKFVYHWRKILNGQHKQDLPTDFNSIKHLDSLFGVAPDEWIEYLKVNTIDKNQINSSITSYLLNVQKFYNQVPNKTTLIHKAQAMICQGVMYRSNKNANATVERNIYTDTSSDPLLCLKEIQTQVNERLAIILKKIEQALYFSEKISSGLKSTDMVQFIGSIPRYGHTSFPLFVRNWQKRNLPMEIPFAEQKIIIFLSNVNLTILDNGDTIARPILRHRWASGRRANQRFTQAWGIDLWTDIWNRVYHHMYLLDNQIVIGDEEYF